MPILLFIYYFICSASILLFEISFSNDLGSSCQSYSIFSSYNFFQPSSPMFSSFFFPNFINFSKDIINIFYSNTTRCFTLHIEFICFFFLWILDSTFTLHEKSNIFLIFVSWQQLPTVLKRELMFLILVTKILFRRVVENKDSFGQSIFGLIQNPNVIL
jgi:hypothetical protein